MNVEINRYYTLPGLSLFLFSESGISALLILIIHIIQRPFNIVSLLMIMVALYDLFGCFEQLGCDINSNFFAKSHRPRTFTICIFQSCYDFNVGFQNEMNMEL
jgi:hypothetical protein